MVAIRHGAGRVVAIGTWKAFLDEIVDGQGQNKHPTPRCVQRAKQ
jgi:hypothetical protein